MSAGKPPRPGDPGWPQPGDPDYLRWCIYCLADCHVEEPEHAPDCPSSTGVFPITEEHGTRCRLCGELDIDVSCMICRAPFALGDSYVLVGGEEKPERPVPGIEGAYFAGYTVCVGCAAAGRSVEDVD